MVTLTDEIRQTESEEEGKIWAHVTVNGVLKGEDRYTILKGGASLSRETGSLPTCREVVHYRRNKK